MKFSNIFKFSFVSVCLLASCEQTKFAGGNKVVKKTLTASEEGGTASIMRSITSNAIPLNSKVDQKIWVVTTNGHANLITLNGDTATSKKTWTGVKGGGGTRTYLTEGGFVASRYPYVYFIDPDNTPEGPIPAENIKNVGANARICMASYMKGGNRYIIGAWGGAGQWFEIPLTPNKPYRPMWDSMKTGAITTGSGDWGYSCYIDQKKKVFYSKWHNTTVSRAINLETLTGVNPATTAPNAAFDSTNIPQVTKGLKGGSYVMSGDPDGNVFNGAGVYTMAYDKDSDSVWVSVSRATNNIGVFPRACLVSQATCTGFAWYNSPDPAYIGPMSALSDGRIAGLTRSTANVYVMSLKNKQDRMAGINSVKVSVIPGDPYMYTDFTGATLYVLNYEGTVNMSEIQGFERGSVVKQAEFVWAAKANATSSEWVNTKVEVRCYSNPNAKPAFEEVGSIAAAGTPTLINAASCKDVAFEFVDVKFTQGPTNSNLADVESFQVTAGY